MSDTPRTAAVAMALRTEDVGWAACSMMEKHAQGLERELAEAKEANAELVKDNEWQKQYALRWEKAATVAMNEVQEQARLLGISGSREAKLLAQVEALKVDAERYKDYANVLRLFIEGVEWDSELPLDVWAICQHWNNNAAIDAARGEK